jgi:hypothetical protein
MRFLLIVLFFTLVVNLFADFSAENLESGVRVKRQWNYGSYDAVEATTIKKLISKCAHRDFCC